MFNNWYFVRSIIIIRKGFFLFWLQSFQKVQVRPQKKVVDKIRNGYISIQNCMPSANFGEIAKKFHQKNQEAIENSFVWVKAWKAWFLPLLLLVTFLQKVVCCLFFIFELSLKGSIFCYFCFKFGVKLFFGGSYYWLVETLKPN